MKSCWQNINPFLNQQRRMQRWERERMGGQARFIIRSALLFGLIMTSSYDLFDGRFEISTVITSHITGLIAGLAGWWLNERDYKKALIAANLNAAPTGQIPKNLT
jgi:membrane associated rhomboid family serine protease